jgi:hypothetical protein
MLMIKVELWPGGRPEGRREIARATIANVSELADVSNYVVVRGDDFGRFEAVSVDGHRRSAGVWALVARALSPRASPKIRARDQPAVEAMVTRFFLRS